MSSSLAYMRDWNRKNLEHVKKYRRAYYRRTKKHQIEKSMKWMRKNAKRWKVYMKKWRSDNREHVRKGF